MRCVCVHARVCVQVYWELGLSRRLQVWVCACVFFISAAVTQNKTCFYPFIFLHIPPANKQTHTHTNTSTHTWTKCFLLKRKRFKSFSAVCCMNKCSICLGLVFHLSSVQGQEARDTHIHVYNINYTNKHRWWIGEVDRRKKIKPKKLIWDIYNNLTGLLLVLYGWLISTCKGIYRV